MSEQWGGRSLRPNVGPRPADRTRGYDRQTGINRIADGAHLRPRRGVSRVPSLAGVPVAAMAAWPSVASTGRREDRDPGHVVGSRADAPAPSDPDSAGG